MKLRRLTPTGSESFATYLSQLRDDPKLPPPVWLLEDDKASVPVADIEVTERVFANRLAAASFLYELFEAAELTNVDRDAGLWTWLTLFYFDQVCPPKKGKERKAFKEEFRYIPAMANFQKYYRHLLYGPYVIFSQHRSEIERASALLIGPVDVSNDVIEQIASRLEYVANPDLVSAVTKLYVDPEKQDYKYGAKGSGKGSPRRLATVLQQFDLTFDISGMNSTAILELLPSEFDRFRK